MGDQSHCTSENEKSSVEEIHTGHQGIVKTKAFARKFVWWPGLDLEVEQL